MGCTYSGNNEAFLPHLQELPPDFTSCLTHTLLQVSSNIARMSGKKSKGGRRVPAHQNSGCPARWERGAGRRAPAEALRITSGAAQGRSCRSASTGWSVPAAAPKTVFGDVCLSSCWRYRSAMSRSPRVCCSLTYVCPVLLVQILEESCLWC